MFKRIIPVAALAGIVFTQSAFSQEEAPAYRSEATVQALGSFLKSTTAKGVEQSATHSGGVLASYRFFFDRHNGVEVNYGYQRNTQSYGLTNGPLGLATDAHEFSADYVLRFPMKRWSPFVLGGVGALVFDPGSVPQSTLAGFLAPNTPGSATTQTRAAFIYGGGADLNLTSRFYLRAEYRGFVYNSPTYDFPGLSGFDRVTHRAQPSIGFGFRF
jgi:opacity protein-like surface antigen